MVEQKQTHNILIIDDEADIRMLLSGILEDEGYQTAEAANAEEGFAAINQQMPDLIILDIWLEGSHLDGIQILKSLKETYQYLPIIMISGHGTIETAVQSLKFGAYDFIEKPFKSDRLLTLINRAFESSQLKKENSELKAVIQKDVYVDGTTPQAKQLKKLLEQTAVANSRVLISGPPGCGKNFYAKYVHSLSKRSDAPFIKVQCANLTSENFDALFFGKVTDKLTKKRTLGFLDQANKGTIYLEEVGDLKVDLQLKLSHILQKNHFSPQESEEKIGYDIRFIASTQYPMTDLIERDQFKEDLYYRLNVAPIDIPNLSERAQDIMIYFNHFVEKFATEKARHKLALDKESRAIFETYHWPGNLRQLKNTVEWLYMLKDPSDESMVKAAELPKDLHDKSLNSESWHEEKDVLSMNLKDAREAFEKEYISAQLKRFGGNISQTAHFIGMERSALHRKLKSLNIEYERGSLMKAI